MSDVLDYREWLLTYHPNSGEWPSINYPQAYGDYRAKMAEPQSLAMSVDVNNRLAKALFAVAVATVVAIAAVPAQGAVPKSKRDRPTVAVSDSPRGQETMKARR